VRRPGAALFHALSKLIDEGILADDFSLVICLLPFVMFSEGLFLECGGLAPLFVWGRHKRDLINSKKRMSVS